VAGNHDDDGGGEGSEAHRDPGPLVKSNERGSDSERSNRIGPAQSPITYQSSTPIELEFTFTLSMAARDIEKDAEEEQVHFQNVITAFQQYAPYSVGALRLAQVALLLNT
jgi:hypothetical protein